MKFYHALTGETSTEGEVGVLLNRFKPASDFMLLTVPRRYFCCGSYSFMYWRLFFFAVGA